ncbi:hypothetical protein [Glycomyces salinus]|uniref:hypothetical protein n=1 Tax=Glycomyces salinus TaxID=980294 RepID=UPI0018EBC250|nr:hypothetical protein [Glycomyces salinus]
MFHTGHDCGPRQHTPRNPDTRPGPPTQLHVAARPNHDPLRFGHEDAPSTAPLPKGPAEL